MTDWTRRSLLDVARVVAGRAPLAIAVVVGSVLLVVAALLGIGRGGAEPGVPVADKATQESRAPAVASRAPAVDLAARQRARSDRFWHQIAGSFEASGPTYLSLADLGARSEGIVLGTFTGEVEIGRVIRDSPSDPTAGVYFANVTFRVEEVLGGGLPEQYRERVKVEYMIPRPESVASLAEVVPTERTVLFIASKYLRRGGIQDVYYSVGLGTGTFPELEGRVAPLGLPVDPERGRLEGMPFERFIALVREVPVLDLMPEGA